MSLPYFLADDPASGVLTGAEAKHAHVKRIEPGEHIMLIDGQGSAAVTRVTSVTPSRVDGVVEKQARVPRPSPRVTVVQAVPKGCLLYTSPSPRDKRQSRMPSSA